MMWAVFKVAYQSGYTRVTTNKLRGRVVLRGFKNVCTERARRR